MMRTSEGSDGKCLLLVCADVAWRELSLTRLIAEVLECLEDFDVLACNASATVPFQVHPGCGLKREQQSDFQRSVLLDC